MAVAVGFAAFARQNQEYMHGFDGYAGILQPPLPGGASGPTAFYYLTLVLLMACYAGLTWVSRSRFGYALQAIRDDARRAESLGYRTDAHRIAAFGLAGVVAAVGGLLDVWYQGRIAPASVDIGPTINILILCVLGGLYSLRGALVGALVFKLLTVFATDLVGAQHINLLTGSAFLLVTIFSADGIVGAMRHITARSSPLGRAPPEETRAASTT